MNRKGIFYTMAAIAITIVIFVTYSAYTRYTLKDKMGVTQIRIETVNFFIKDVEKDINKGIFIAGYRSLLSFNQFIVTNGSFIDDINQRFKEAFLNGTINQQQLSLLDDSTFTNWANRIAVEANKIDILFNFTINDVKINQSSPWSVDIGLNITLDIRDKRDTSYWVRDRYLTSRISIIGFEDPLYIVNSQGRVTNVVIQSNITNFVVNGNVENLLLHANNSYYIQHNDSPSFLMRFEGKLDNSTYGIESLVNLGEFQEQGLTIKDRSIVDSVYFGTVSTINYRVNNTPPWFKIDQEHLDTYQVTNITI